MSSEAPEYLRRVRSFVRRPGRLTPAQARALEDLLPRYRLDETISDVRQAFGRTAPLILEIGFGNGEALAWMAAHEPDHDFIGVEVHEPGVGHLLRSLDREALDNVRVAMRDAVELLEQQVQAATLQQARIYFPDPWPKKRHHKRRIVQPEFVQLLADRIAPGGHLHLATDWAPYADWMLEIIAGCPAFCNQGKPWVERPSWRPQTRFERRGLKRGHEIFDLLFVRA